eukprot:EG_transcript_9460
MKFCSQLMDSWPSTNGTNSISKAGGTSRPTSPAGGRSTRAGSWPLPPCTTFQTTRSAVALALHSLHSRRPVWRRWAGAALNPVIKSVLRRVFAYYRRYTAQCVEYRVCPTGLVYRFKDDNTFDRISWPKRQAHCYGSYGTLVMLGPLLFSAGVVAAQHAAGPAVDELRLRLVPADLRQNLVYDFRMLNRSTDTSDRKALYCAKAVYQSQREPIYLPVHVSVPLFHRRTTIPRDPSPSLDCPRSPNYAA